VFICYDLRFPEIFRQIAEEVEVIFVIANWPHTREMHWQNLLIARAIENQCFIVGVNRIGNDGVGLKYNGSSMVINPSGEVLLQTDKITEYDTCDIDISMVSKTRKDFPFLEDIRFI
jgi:predicted amidohydrolase